MMFKNLLFFILAVVLLPLSTAEARLPHGGAQGGATTQGYTGQISISGNTFVNGHGTVLRLIGVNNSGLEVSGFFGASAASWGGNGAPNWALLGSWASTMTGNDALITRIPLNSASFLGLVVYTPTNSTTWGALLTSAGNGTADPDGDYKSSIVTAIQAARAIHAYIDFDLHWGAIQLTLGGTTHYAGYQGQLAFMDGTGLTFWENFTTWLAQNFGSAAFNTAHGINGGAAGTYYNASYGGSSGFADILFELFNEPFMGTGSYGAGSADLTLLNGGTGTTYITNGAGNITTGVTYTGYQAVVNGIRAIGATNPIIVNGNQYSQNLQNYTTWLPTDTGVNQIALGNHPYSAAAYPYTGTNTVYPLIGTDTGGPSSWAAHVGTILTAGYPVIITEDGCDSGNNAGTGYTLFEPHMTYTSSIAATNNMGYIGWTWGAGDYIEAYSTAGAANVMLRENAGSTAFIPIAGEGWMMYLLLSGNSEPSITNGATLPAGNVSTSYSVTFAPAGGAGSPYTFAWVSDSGSGCTSGSLNTSSGVYSCTLTATPGTYSIVVDVIDQYLITVPYTFSLQVNGSSGPLAPTNLQLVQQGGTSNNLTNSQKISWTASAGAVSYDVYRNGSSLATGVSCCTYTDAAATNSNQQNTYAPSTPYTYSVSGVNAGSVEGPQQTNAAIYWYQTGVAAQSQTNYSYSLSTLNWADTTGAPPTGTYDIQIVSPASSGFQPVSYSPLVPDYGMEIGGGYQYVTFDMKITDTTTTLFMGAISRPGYPGSTDYYPHAQVNVLVNGTSAYGTPVLNGWATFKVPLTSLSIGVTQLHGYISGTTFTQTSLTSGPGCDGGAYVTGAGVTAGTFINAQPGSLSGPFTVNNSQTVGSSGSPIALTCTRQNVYKLDWGNNSSPTTTYYLNNIGFTTN